MSSNFLYSIPHFSLADTLDCGQCFRFEKVGDNTFRGVAKNRLLTVSQQQDTLVFHNIFEEEFSSLWQLYFDFSTDYESMKKAFARDPVLARACEKAGGIRILRQDSWEALCSFIISQNNNIPRIKGIISRLCAAFGEPLGDVCYTFPTPEVLAACSLDDLAPLKAGFRAKYILDAARRVASGEISLAALETAPIDEARKILQTILGVGPKVAECALLFGFYRLEAFPIDTWIKKALTRYYPNGLPEYAVPLGVAQQMLFHAIRNHFDEE